MELPEQLIAVDAVACIHEEASVAQRFLITTTALDGNLSQRYPEGFGGELERSRW